MTWILSSISFRRQSRRRPVHENTSPSRSVYFSLGVSEAVFFSVGGTERRIQVSLNETSVVATRARLASRSRSLDLMMPPRFLQAQNCSFRHCCKSRAGSHCHKLANSYVCAVHCFWTPATWLLALVFQMTMRQHCNHCTRHVYSYPCRKAMEIKNPWETIN